ncbi:MAG: metal-dependent transcriptional regulator [Arcanobacterium sp.]
MNISHLPDKSQDLLKVAWDYAERHGNPVPMGELARRTEQKPSTTTEAVKRLAAQGLLKREPYGGVELTAAGREIAVAMIRRHRLLETFLVRVLSYTWDEVHADADLLEHSVSERFITRVDELLGHPTRDPHGDPIPQADGTIAAVGGKMLLSAPVGKTVVVDQIDDDDPDLLRYLAKHGVIPGARVRVLGSPVGGLIQITRERDATDNPIPLGVDGARAIFVVESPE